MMTMNDISTGLSDAKLAAMLANWRPIYSLSAQEVAMFDQIDAALRRSGNGGDVRALEWEAYGERSDLRAEVPWGYYRITYSEISRLGQWLWDSGLSRGWVPIDTEAEAKAAAQADFETRILSVLEVKP